MAEGYLSGSGKNHSGDRYLVHVHTDMETLRADGTGAESEIDEARNVSAETSRRLSCDAGLVHWLETKKGEPLSVGRKTRTIPPAIRRALQRRDNGCCFPGCTCSRFLQAHHVSSHVATCSVCDIGAAINSRHCSRDRTFGIFLLSGKRSSLLWTSLWLLSWAITPEFPHFTDL